MKIQHSKQKLEFLCETSYPAKYWDESLDSKIRKLAREFKGSLTGSGLGVGFRDNGFSFKSALNRQLFIEALKKENKTLHVSKVFLSVYLP